MQECIAVRRALVECRRTQVHLALAQSLVARRKMLSEMRSMLRVHRFEIVASVSALRRTCHAMRNSSAGATGNHGEESGARAVRTHGEPTLGFRAKRAFASASGREEEVLHTVQAHPEGIKLVDMGNEVGVDWRRLVQPAHTLTDAGRIEQMDELFYPIR